LQYHLLYITSIQQLHQAISTEFPDIVAEMSHHIKIFTSLYRVVLRFY